MPKFGRCNLVCFFFSNVPKHYVANPYSTGGEKLIIDISDWEFTSDEEEEAEIVSDQEKGNSCELRILFRFQRRHRPFSTSHQSQHSPDGPSYHGLVIGTSLNLNLSSTVHRSYRIHLLPPPAP